MRVQSLWRLCALVCAVNLFWTFSAHSETPVPPAAAPVKAEKTAKAQGQDYVRFVGDNVRGKLETVVVTMENADGVQVELIGAVHIADAAYYQELTNLFKNYESLLFELVDGQSLKESVQGKAASRKPAPAAQSSPRSKVTTARAVESNHDEPAASKNSNPAFDVLRIMMQGLGSYLRLEYQTDGIDYHTENFVHADVSMAEFHRLQEEKGESFASIFRKALEAEFKRSVATRKDEEPTGGQLLLALLGDSSGLKIAMARILGKSESLGEDLGFGPDSVIVGERNRVALEVFDQQVKAGRKKLGIFYGAAHLSDLENRLEKRGYQRTGERWLTAWDIKPRADDKKADPAPKKAIP